MKCILRSGALKMRLFWNKKSILHSIEQKQNKQTKRFLIARTFNDIRNAYLLFDAVI